jgi:hypothetical protein
VHGSLTIHGNLTDGFNISPIGNEDDGGKLSTLAFRGGVGPTDNLRVDGTLRMSDNHAGRDGFNGDYLNGLVVRPRMHRSSTIAFGSATFGPRSKPSIAIGRTRSG